MRASFFANARGVHISPTVAPLVEWCQHLAPILVNTYSDGGVAHPTRHRWQLGGSGVWHPGRSEEPTHEELDYAHTKALHDGVEAWVNSAAMWCSSTRMELLGGIIALLAPGPVHIGTDSAAFLNMARQNRSPSAWQTSQTLGSHA